MPPATPPKRSYFFAKVHIDQRLAVQIIAQHDADFLDGRKSRGAAYPPARVKPGRLIDVRV